MYRGGGNSRLASHIKEFNLFLECLDAKTHGGKVCIKAARLNCTLKSGGHGSYHCLTNVDKRLRNKCAMTWNSDMEENNFTDKVFSRFTPHFLLKKAAFTLAEVLITLGIIGVVAAMTIPSLIQNYQEKVLANQFKKSYSMFSQVLNQVLVDNDMSVPSCYYNQHQTSYDFSACNEVSAAVLKKLNVVKTCEKKSYENGCIPKYSGLRQSYLQGFTQDWILNHSKSYVLVDGTIILEYGDDAFPAIFAIDINGKKAPNKWGYDLFSFWTISNGGYYILQGTYYSVEDGGKTTNQMMKN